MSKEHSHHKKDDLAIFFIPADERIPMEMRVIKHALGPMQRIVGGYVEIVRTEHMPNLGCGCRTVLVVNEEGAIRRLMHNPRATMLYRGPNGWIGHNIYGDALLVGEGPIESDGFPEMDFISLPQEFNTWKGPGQSVPKASKISRIATKHG